MTETTAYWLRIDCPEVFTAGVRIRDDRVVRTAPRFEGMFTGWSAEQVRQFALNEGWSVETVNDQ
jgi:hypothetical protein